MQPGVQNGPPPSRSGGDEAAKKCPFVSESHSVLLNAIQKSVLPLFYLIRVHFRRASSIQAELVLGGPFFQSKMAVNPIPLASELGVWR